MAALQDLRQDGSLRRLSIDKQHLQLENLVPAIQVRDVSNSDVFTIPFNHIMSFEYQLVGEGAKGQATMEIFDPTHNLMSLVFFNLAQGTTYGLPIEIRWGWVNNPGDSNRTLDHIQTVSTRYFSQPYKFFVVSVEEKPEPHGTSLSVGMFPYIFHPVLTKAFVNTTFVTGRKKQEQPDVIQQIRQNIGEDEFTRYQRAINVYQDQKEELQRRASEGTVTDPNRDATGTTVIDGPLTFSRIFNELMAIADERQVQLGPRAEQRWQRPLLVLPNSVDDEYDYQVFEGRNDNVYLCMNRLFEMMVSKVVTGSKNERTSRGVDTASGKESANRMVGAKYSFHSARLRNSATQLLIKSSRDNFTNLSPEQLDADQENFVFSSFKSSEYEYLLDTDEPPIATYTYFGGSKNFDPNDTAEIIDYSIQNSDIFSAFFLANDQFKVTTVTNPTTNISVDVGDPVPPNDRLDKSPSLSSDENSTKATKDTTTVSENGTKETDEVTNPENERTTGNKKATRIVANPQGEGKIQEFDIPIVVSQDGETVDNASRRFLDLIRSRTGKAFPIIVELTIVGDPRYDMTIVTALKKIRLVFRNRFGEENALISGIYLVRDARHTISNGEYRTVLMCNKMSLKQLEEGTSKEQDREGFNDFGNFDEITVALLQITISESSNESGGSTASVTNIRALPGLPDNTTRRIDRILELREKGTNSKILTNLTNEMNNYIRGLRLAEARAQLQDYVRAKQYEESELKKGRKDERKTNFKVKDILINRPPQ